jgi:hypothetical protein
MIQNPSLSPMIPNQNLHQKFHCQNLHRLSRQNQILNRRRCHHRCRRQFRLQKNRRQSLRLTVPEQAEQPLKPKPT